MAGRSRLMWASALTLAGLMVTASAMSVVASDHKSGHGRDGVVSQQRGQGRDQVEDKKDKKQDQNPNERRGSSNRNVESSESLVTSPTTVTPPGTVTPPAEPGDDGKAVVEDRCVVGHVAGKSGKGQLRGGGVHLVIEGDEAGALDEDLLIAAADTLADHVCNDEELTDAEFQAAVDAVDGLAGVSVSHANAYQGDGDDEDEDEEDEDD